MASLVEEESASPADSTLRQRRPLITSSPPTSSSSSPSSPSSSCTCPTSDSHPSAPPSPSLGSALKTCTAQLAYDLLPFERLPLWVRDNPHITHGYRVDIGWKNSCHSLCHLHNETINIWTHFIAFALMLVLLVVTLLAMSPHGVDRLNMGLVELAKVKQAFTASQPLAFICPLDRPLVDPATAPSSMDPTFPHLTGTNCSVEEHTEAGQLGFLSGVEHLFSSSSSYLPTPVTEVVDRLRHHLPSVQRLTRALRDQADSIATLVSNGRSSLSSSLPISPFSSTQSKFLSFLTRVESHLSSLHSTVSSTLTLDNALHLKQLIHQNVGGFTQHLTAKQVDLVRVVKAMMAEFVKSVREEEGAAGVDGQVQGGDGRRAVASGLVDEEGLGLAVRVRKWAGLGDGDVFFAMHGQQTSSSQLLQQSLEAQERARRRDWEEDVQLHFYLPRWPLTVFMVSAQLCLLFSALFHCFQAVSEPMAVLFQGLDYAGITLLIAGSNIPVIYYGFYCSPVASTVYNTCISALAVVCFLITILPSFRSLRFRTLKTLLFLALGCSGVIPLVHLVLDLGYIHFIVYYLLAMGAFYIGGAIVYLFHIPERWWPGKFDLWMSSHQIWHLTIVAAVLTHYLGVIHLFEWRFHHVCRE